MIRLDYGSAFPAGFAGTLALEQTAHRRQAPAEIALPLGLARIGVHLGRRGYGAGRGNAALGPLAATAALAVFERGAGHS